MINFENDNISSDIKVLSDEELNEIAAGGFLGNFVGGLIGRALGLNGIVAAANAAREYNAAVSVASWFAQHWGK
jgi:hypothetical protein